MEAHTGDGEFLTSGRDAHKRAPVSAVGDPAGSDFVAGGYVLNSQNDQGAGLPRPDLSINPATNGCPLFRLRQHVLGFFRRQGGQVFH